MPDLWQATRMKMAAALAATLLLDYLTGLPGVFTILLLLWWLRQHLRSTRAYHHWLGGNGSLYPPEGEGIWAEIHDLTIKRIRQRRKRLHQGVQLMREFRHAASALPDAVMILDARRHILWMNQRCETLLGLNPRKDTGVTITNLIRTPAFTRWFARQDDSSITLAAPLNSRMRLQYRRIPYGTNRHMLLVRDVTERERIEQTRKDFVANVSHELRTPLTVLSGYLEMMQQAELREWQPAIRQMREQSQRMQNIIDDLLTLSRMDGENLLENQQALNIPAWMQALAKEARALSNGRHGIELKQQSDQWLQGHESLYQAFSNLVSNAVRYTPEGGKITLIWRTGPEGGEFAVMDTGIGIPRQHIPRITERFYRVDSDRSREAGGTGLGLAIVKNVLQQHGAHLLVESEVGRGSTFSCAFPARMLRAPQAKNPAETIS